MLFFIFLKGLRVLKIMRIFVFGANGMLGNYVKTYLANHYEVIGITRKDYDILNISQDSLTKFLKSVRIKKDDVIINCAGIIPQTGVNEKRNYYLVNTLFPIILSFVCQQLKVKMLHITTDCVFSGKDGNYDENSIPDETNDYGTSKSLGEIIEATVIRTSIIGEQLGQNYSLLEWIRSNKNGEINGYVDHHWNGVTCLQLAKIIHGIISQNLFWKGCKHIFSPSPVSKYELLKIINDVYDLNIKINPVNTKICDKTLTSIYDKMFEIPDIRGQIKELVNYLF